MSCFFQVFFFALSSYWIDVTSGTPVFKGFSVHKGFEVNLKPIESMIWSPFGRFGVRRGIQKRDLEDVKEPTEERIAASPAPVYEAINEGDKEAILIKERSSVPDSAEPKFQGLFTNTIRESDMKNELERHVPLGMEEIYEELPPRSIKPILIEPVQHIPVQPVREQPVRVIPQPISTPMNIIPLQRESFLPVQQISSPRPIDLISLPGEPGVRPAEVIVTPRPMGAVTVQPLFYPASPVPVQPFVTNEIPSIVPPSPVPPRVSEIPPAPVEGPIIRGSRLALYYGNVFLQLFSQFLSNARLRFSQQPTPPPMFN